ncbi:hypothetical protein M406DRAFT_356979 [Cryphonectria parasitica EP155]|uniref:Cytochrome P450 n=1 Tax=Cryphonectria parasitica (strain ATCC 38755 / EP155) TaxID=660469 RepID=A0A9P4XXM2_CRYP1|nr:uncharacterized protein M406DRAFT_356979 [Cryphonectria parasitica EP155]KAF3763222.1 hypothetical protein M406DRAFT_356979 [Cryphonectria parasitica EP155]
MRRPTRPGLVNWLFHSRRWRESKTAMREGYAAPVITHRRRNPTSRRDLLGALLKGRDPDTGEALRESQIVDEVVTMPIGSSTAPCALASALYFLCKNRECFVKARKEVDEVLGPWVGGAGGGEENTDDDEEDDEEEEEEEDVQMTAEQLGRLSYIEGVVRETLRLSAAAPGFNIEPIPRTTAAGDVDTAPVLLGGGKYAVTHDQAMIIVLAGVNTDPSVFDDPLSFRPERMMREALEALPAGVKKWFGNGRRECIGKNWAWMFMVTVLAVLVRRCDFEMVDEEGWTWKQDGWFNIRPVGLRMKVTRRKAATAAAA